MRPSQLAACGGRSYCGDELKQVRLCRGVPYRIIRTRARLTGTLASFPTSEDRMRRRQRRTKGG